MAPTDMGAAQGHCPKIAKLDSLEAVHLGKVIQVLKAQDKP